MMLPLRTSQSRRYLITRLALAMACMGLALAGVSGTTSAGPAATTTDQKGASGLQLPRYVSLRSDQINLRAGPGTEYPTTWVFRRAGLPVEVFEEFENWRHVRDSEGTEGWIYASLLSGRRTALILPWERGKENQAAKQIAIYADDDLPSRKVAIVEAGVIANIHGCDRKWCDVSIDRYRGFIQQNKLWGVYPKERVK